MFKLSFIVLHFNLDVFYQTRIDKYAEHYFRSRDYIRENRK